MINVIFLGPIKQPSYYYDEYLDEHEVVEYYHITCGDYRSGDEIKIDGQRFEVYCGKSFENDIELCDYLEENYPDIYEI